MLTETNTAPDIIKNFFEELLDGLGLEYFWGGSRRFGWSAEDSDFDLFVKGGEWGEGSFWQGQEEVFVPPKNLIELLNLTLKNKSNMLAYPESTIIYETTMLGYNIDIGFFPSNAMFYKLAQEHVVVAAWTKKNFDKILFHWKLVNNRPRGKKIYQEILHTALTEEREFK